MHCFYTAGMCKTVMRATQKMKKEFALFLKKCFRLILKGSQIFMNVYILYQSYCWYAFIRQDFLMYYRYSKKWVDLFDEEPAMVTVETGHYIKGMHTLLNAIIQPEQL